MNKWLILQHNGFYEIEPINDLKPHTFCMSCSCEPKMEEIEGTDEYMVIHNAYDSREVVENAVAAINKSFKQPLN